GAVVSGDRRHHDIVGLRGGGPADAERRGAAGGAAAGAHGAAEPDDEGSRTGLLHVALVRGRSADGARVAGRMLAGSARAVAGIGGAGIAVVQAGGTHVASGMRARRARAAAQVGGAGVALVRAGRGARLEDVGRTGGAGAGTSLGRVTLARPRAAHRACGQEAVGRAGRARAVALVQGAGVAVVRAGGARVAHRVLAGVAGAIALVQGAGVAVRTAGRPARLLDVGGGAGGTGAGAVLGKITLAGGGAADRTRVARGVLAGGAGAVALVQGAGVTIVRAGGACVGEAAVHLAAGGVSVCRAQVTLLSRFDNPVAAGSGGIGERHLRAQTGGAPGGGQRECHADVEDIDAEVRVREVAVLVGVRRELEVRIQLRFFMQDQDDRLARLPARAGDDHVLAGRVVPLVGGHRSGAGGQGESGQETHDQGDEAWG